MKEFNKTLKDRDYRYKQTKSGNIYYMYLHPFSSLLSLHSNFWLHTKFLGIHFLLATHWN